MRKELKCPLARFSSAGILSGGGELTVSKDAAQGLQDEVTRELAGAPAAPLPPLAGENSHCLMNQPLPLLTSLALSGEKVGAPVINPTGRPRGISRHQWWGLIVWLPGGNPSCEQPLYEASHRCDWRCVQGSWNASGGRERSDGQCGACPLSF